MNTVLSDKPKDAEFLSRELIREGLLTGNLWEKMKTWGNEKSPHNPLHRVKRYLEVFPDNPHFLILEEDEWLEKIRELLGVEDYANSTL